MSVASISAVEIYERYATGSRWVVGLPTLMGITGMLVIAATSGLTAAAKLDWLLSAKIVPAGSRKPSPGWDSSRSGS